MPNKTVSFSGYAARFQPTWCDAQSGRSYCYTPSAFNSFLQSSSAIYLPVQIEHDRNFKLPQARLTALEVDRQGLRFDLQITADNAFSRGAVLAVQHGHLTGVSLAMENIKTLYRSRLNDPELISSCVLRELSLTSSPACPGCRISATTGPQTATKSQPSNPTDRANLTAFLKQIGHEVAPQPQAHSQAAQHKSDALISRETQVFLANYYASLLPLWPEAKAEKPVPASLFLYSSPRPFSGICLL